MANHGHFVWYELTTTDADAARSFYSSVVGWATRDASAPGAAYTLFVAGDTPIAGMMGLPAEARRAGVKPRWMGYVGVDDVDAITERIKRLGGSVFVPPTDVPDVSRFAIVADPQMATFALFKWLRSADEQKPVAPEAPGHVGWHELFAVNWEKAFAFYAELFSWQKVDADVGGVGTYQLFSVGGQTIGGMSTKTTSVPMAFWLYYIKVGNIDAAVERVTAGGGKVLEGPVEAPSGNWIARCEDPQGAMFALLGEGRDKVSGYFEPAAARDPAATRFYVPKKPS